jgi:hypothetical protein
LNNIISINKSTRYGSLDYFTLNCVDETLQILKDELMDRLAVTILPVKKARFLQHSGGASHDINIFDKNYDGTRPPKLKEVIAEITLCNDIESLIGKKTCTNNFEKRFFEFIESLGVEINVYSIFTISLLHELGHSNLIKLFLDLGMEKEYDNLYHLAKATVMATGSYKQNELWEKTHKISLGQTADVQENFADAYALKNFPRVWNVVKHYIRPELKNKSTTAIVRYNQRFNLEDRKYVKVVGEDRGMSNLFKEIFG